MLATGGASNNKVILQVLSDVFNTPVYTMVGPDIPFHFPLSFSFMYMGGYRLCRHLKRCIDYFHVSSGYRMWPTQHAWAVHTGPSMDWLGAATRTSLRIRP